MKANRKLLLIFGMVGSGKSTLTKMIIDKFKGIKNIIILDALGEYDDKIIFNNFSEFFQNYIIGSKSTYTCRFTEDSDVEKLFQLVKIVGNCLLVIDEAELFLSDLESFDTFKWLIRYGRHKQVSMILCARRVTELKPDVRAQYTSIFTFRQRESIDITRLSSMGFSEISLLSLKQFVYGENIHKYYLTLGEKYDEVQKNL